MLKDECALTFDTAFSPERPIPSGRIRAGQAVIIAIGALLSALAAAIPFGTLALVFAILADRKLFERPGDPQRTTLRELEPS